MSLPASLAQKKHISLHGLVYTTVMMSPGHTRPIVQAGGGQANSVVPVHNPYLSDILQSHLNRIYDKLRGSEPALSRERLEEFLANTQAQPTQFPIEKADYSFEEFLGAVWYANGFQVVKERPLGEKDLTKPISHYFISSSHNTYLSGNQLSSKSSTEAYKNVLIRGCRCIEIDVWNGEVSTNEAQRPHILPHKSSHALASHATSAISKGVKEAFDHGKHFMADKIGHHRIPSINSEAAAEDEDFSAIDSTVLVAQPEKPRSTFGSRHNSNSSTRPEPRVLHGWTLTSEVSFRDVCKTIRETAFVNNNLPIIVSLEVHADLEQQEIMVDIMKEEWKGHLIDEAHLLCDPAKRLPRLEEVLGKILVKVKKATPIVPSHVSTGLEHVTNSTTPSLNTPTSLTPIHPSMSAPAPSSSSQSLSPSQPDQADSGQSGSDDDRNGKPRKKKSKICENLGRMGIYTHSAHFTSFEQEDAFHPPHIYSISETQILELHSTKQAEMFAHNRRFFMRAYPAGRRVDSSNPDPSVFWRKGVQMVALNWQSWDEGTMVNEAMFGGEHGWVLKPAAYRSHEGMTEPVPAIRRVTMNLKITILAGQRIPLPLNQSSQSAFYPYVKCELHIDKAEGLQTEMEGRTKEGKYKLMTKYRKSSNPDWGPDGAVMYFESIPNVIEDLCFLRFKVEDEKYTMDKLAAWNCIRIDRVQQGHRFVPLFDAKGIATDGLLLVKIEKTIIAGGSEDKPLLNRIGAWKVS